MPDHAPWDSLFTYQAVARTWLGHTYGPEGLGPSKVMWPSFDNCATMCHPGHLIGRLLALCVRYSWGSGFIGVWNLASAHALHLPTNLCEYFKVGLNFRLQD